MCNGWTVHICVLLLRLLPLVPQMTEFIIATIPTYLGVNESGRLLQALRKEGIPCKRIVVNQVQ
jgi:anion-transporting  ArsA/GET3 family ATPase